MGLADANGNGNGRARSSEIALLSVLAFGIALLAGAAAFLLFRLIGVFTNAFFYGRLSWDVVDPAASPLFASPWRFLVCVIPAVGGLLVALMIRHGSEKISGHGIPEAMEAVLVHRSEIEARVGVLKPLSTAIAIGSGGPFGAEGPIIQTGGALGSLLAQSLRLTTAEKRTLLAAGAAAGMAATFGTPIAGILLVVELLLFEFRARSIIPVAVASGVGALVHAAIFGGGALFPLASGVPFGGFEGLPLFLLLGVVCGVVASFLTRSLYRLEDGMRRLPVAKFWLPVLGGFAVGAVAFFEPRILGIGYGSVQGLLGGPAADPALWLLGGLLALLAGKAVAWLLALSSGTSGGVLAPLFLLGGAVGAIFGVGVQAVAPGLGVPPVAFAFVGMAAVFGSSARATLASIVFAAEVSHAPYEAFVPLVIGCVAADAVAILLLGDTTIMTEKLARRGLRVRHEYEANLLDLVAVREVMAPKVHAVPEDRPVADLLRALADPKDPEYWFRSFPVVDREGRVVGVVTRTDLERVRALPGPRTAGDVATRPAVVVRAWDPCSAALSLMVARDVGHLPVVDEGGACVGYLSRGDLMSAWRRRIEEEQEQEVVARFRGFAHRRRAHA